jgi:hypothetical protein
MTWTPRSVRSNAITAAMPRPTATITPGIRGHQRRAPRITTMPSSPTASAAPLALPRARPWTKSRTSGISPRPSMENPNSLGSCPTMMVTAIPYR